MLLVAVGPLVPIGDATWRDNIRSPDAAIDLPTIFFAGRLAQVALIAFTGVVGFLVVRAYGLGLAAGGLSVAGWLWITSLIELGRTADGHRWLGIPARSTPCPTGSRSPAWCFRSSSIIIAVIVALVTRLTTRAPASPPNSYDRPTQHRPLDTAQHDAWG